MAKGNKFGFDAVLTDEQIAQRRARRSPGPMGAAVREAADSLTNSTAEKVEMRKQNATDAKDYRAAVEEGRLLVNLKIDEVLTTALPRDRIDLDGVIASDEMEELMASIFVRGQREPIEVFRDSDGAYQLKKGWRRLTALRQLYAKSGNEDFATVIARIDSDGSDRVGLYVDMVEENIIREDLTFAEMAELAIRAAQDPSLGFATAQDAASRLYASLHKMKRSYVKQFVYLMGQVDGSLRFPKSVSRNLGVDVARKLRTDETGLGVLCAALESCDTADEQADVLKGFLQDAPTSKPAPKAKKPPKQKFEFHLGETKITARNGELRVVNQTDFTGISKAKLERAIQALQDVLAEK